MPFCALCYSQGITSDFEQTLGTLRGDPAHSHQGPHYFVMENAVDGLIAKYRDSLAVEFLEEKTGEPSSRKLALLSLGRPTCWNG